MPAAAAIKLPAADACFACCYCHALLAATTMVSLVSTATATLAAPAMATFWQLYKQQLIKHQR
jgi:hypothetical protein